LSKKEKLPLFLRLILPGFSGILLSFSFPPFNYWYLAWFGFIPLLFSLDKNSFVNFLFGWFSGFVFFGFLLSWLIKVAGPIYILLPLYLSFYWAIFFGVLHILPERGKIFIGAGIWFFLEIIVSYLFTGFPWLLLGISQNKNLFILPLARIFGIYGISIVLILSNLFVFYGFRRKHIFSFVLSVLIFASIFYYCKKFKLEEKPDSYIKILIVQGNISSSEKYPPEKVLKNYYETSVQILNKEKVQLVIWPEGSFPDCLLENKKNLNTLIQFTKKYKCGLILGSFSKKNNNFYNSSYFINEEEIKTYNKIHLVPYGEFILGEKMPFIRKIFIKLAGYTPYLTPGKEFTIFNLQKEKVSTLICFENIFSEIPREFIKKGSNLFIVLTNDSWFGKSFGPYQHFSHNILRAVETGKYFIQVSSTGISGVVSPLGKVEDIIKDNNKEIFVKGYLIKNVPIFKKETFYSKYGDITLFILILIFIGVLICRQ